MKYFIHNLENKRTNKKYSFESVQSIELVLEIINYLLPKPKYVMKPISFTKQTNLRMVNLKSSNELLTI